MRMLSTGEPSTLAVWLEHIAFRVAPDSPALAYLHRRIELEGGDAEVTTDEREMLRMLEQMDHACTDCSNTPKTCAWVCIARRG